MQPPLLNQIAVVLELELILWRLVVTTQSSWSQLPL